MKVSKNIIITVISALTVFTVVALAGSDLIGSGAPSATGVTLEDIYNKLSNNSTSSKNFNPAQDTSVPSFHDLGQIYSLLTPVSSTTITSGTTIMGISGSYNISNLTPDKVATGTSYGTSSIGTLQ